MNKTIQKICDIMLTICFGLMLFITISQFYVSRDIVFIFLTIGISIWMGFFIIANKKIKEL